MGTLTFNDDFIETGLDGVKPQSWNTDVYPHFVAIRTLLNGNVDATNLGVTTGTIAASKVVTVDANKDAGSFRNITLTGELDAGTLDVSGNVDIAGITTLNGTLQVKNGATSAGKIEIYEDSDDGAHKLTLTIPALAGDVTLTLPNSDGSADQLLTTNGSGTLTWEDPTTIDADLTAIGNLGKTDGNFIVGNGSTWVAENGGTARTSLGLGTMAVAATSDYAALAGATFTGAVTTNTATFKTTDAGAGSVKTIAVLEWDPASGTMTNASSGIGIDFKMPDDANNQDVYASINAHCESDATGAEDGSLSFKIVVAGTNTEKMILDETGLTVTNDITSSSDERIKTNIQTIDNALEKVTQLRGASFIKDGKESIGVIAQEVEEIVPEVVVTGKDEEGLKSVAYGNMVGLLIEAIKEQQIQIDKLTNA